MLRKTKTIVIEKENRDKGKVFILNEMSAFQVEKWALRAFLALSRNGFDVPPDIAEKGLAGVAVMGLKSLGNINFEDAEPLLQDMFNMVTILPDPTRPSIKRGYGGVSPIIEDDIEEVSTLFFLRKEMISLHLDFFTPA